MLMIDVNGMDPRNQKPEQELEKEENIRVHLVEINKHFLSNIKLLAESNGYIIADKVWGFGMGLLFASYS